jgi:serine/threonine-protein phosphatase 2B regulatory subunit
MGAGISRRYKYGIRPKKYFNKKIMPEMKETFGILDFNYNRAFELFRAFIGIDFDNSGEITVGEFHSFLGLKETRFSERVFGILDLDESGALEFKEFVIGIWNFCTYDALLITKFAFDIFDVDNIGKLQLAECEALLRMVYDEADADPELMRKIDADGDGEITIDEFSNLIKRQPQILQPAFDMQRALRTKCFGVKFWELATEKRQDFFANYDSLANSSWESIQKILLIRQKEREEQVKREQLEFVAEANERLNEHMDSKKEQFTEQQERREHTLARIKAKELPEEKAEREKWTEFQEAFENMKKNVPIEDMRWKIDERQILWDLVDTLKAMHDVTMDAQQARDVALADGPDGDAKAEAYLRTKAGKKKIRFDTTVCYAKSIHKQWAGGNAIQKLMAPMFHAEVEGQATAMAAIVRYFACGQKRALNQAYVDAKGLTVKNYHKMEKERQLDHYLDLRERSENDFKLLVEEIVENVGTRNSRWEKFTNMENGKHFHYNWKTGQQDDSGDPAICEVCDVILDPVDYKCFDCHTLRSHVNQGKYKGRTPLSDLMEVSFLQHNDNKVDLDSMRKDDDMADFELDDQDDDEGGGMLGRAMRKSRKMRKSFRKSYGKSKVADIGRKSFGGIGKSLTSKLMGD